ncbi:carboxynorspermidine decarboxylase [Salinispira pacifica]|uniref:Carboxynorspermidine/carboxyspermidine decarboxylase n=1 Tax=Salinispira pacifica TaxID=1307761 RepID=V5WIV1_9SPIO|nr:carboxynorspermidine decarboxylase [Salinispira pacifica]AHC15723.1 Carboxynorspermidine decarboxylase, putative [Salinispira pacifica]
MIRGNGYEPFRGFDPERVPSPAYVVDRAAIRHNLGILDSVMTESGAKILLALKGFSMFSLAPEISRVLKGTTASSVHEARLGREEFGGEVHVYAPAFKDEEMRVLLETADHIVFNSFSEWEHHRESCLKAAENRPGLEFGIRINPQHSEGSVELYDPCAPYSRMGVVKSEFRRDLLQGISGLHFHSLCEQGSEPLERTLEAVTANYGDVLKTLKWINLGGGHHISKEDYNRPLLIRLIRELKETYDLEVYLEPGEAIAIHSGVLVTTVLDTPVNAMNLAILDTSATCHMPDVLEMPYRPDILGAGLPGMQPHLYRLGGQTCLAGDVIGDYSFPRPLSRGQRLIFDDMAHYTMVKNTTFNGIPLPSICTYDSDSGEYEVIREFGYGDFRSRLS